MGRDAKYDVLFERVSEMQQLCLNPHQVDPELLVKTFDMVLRQVCSCDPQWRAYLKRRAELQPDHSGDDEHAQKKVPDARRVSFDASEYLREFSSEDSSYEPGAYPTPPDLAVIPGGRCAWIKEPRGVLDKQGGAERGGRGERQSWRRQVGRGKERRGKSSDQQSSSRSPP